MNIIELIGHAKSSKLVRGFVATLMGSGFSKIILALSTFLFANELSKMEFGEFSFVRNTLNTILCMCALNFMSLCTKFTIEAEKSIQSLQRLFILFLFSITVCILVGITLIVLPKDIMISITGTESLIFFFRLIGILLPLFMLQPLLEGVLRGLMKFKLIGVLQTLTALIFVGAVYIGIKISGLLGAVIGILVYYTFYSMICVMVVYKLNPFTNFIQNIKGFQKENTVVPKMILPVFLMSFIEAPALWIAQVLLSKYDSMAAVGSMTAIFQLRNMMILIPTYLFNTLIAFVGKMNSERQYEAYFKRFDKLALILLFVGIVMAVGCSIFAKSLLGLYGFSYKADYIPFIISSLEIPFLLLVGLYKIDLVIQEHQQQLLYSSIFWNVLWICLLLLMLSMSINPLIAFFVSQVIAVSIYTLWIFMIYRKDKKNLLYEK